MFSLLQNKVTYKNKKQLNNKQTQNSTRHNITNPNKPQPHIHTTNTHHTTATTMHQLIVDQQLWEETHKHSYLPPSVKKRETAPGRQLPVKFRINIRRGFVPNVCSSVICVKLPEA